MAPKKGNIPWNNNTGIGWINKKGYHCIKIDGHEKKVHRLVMENAICRPLKKYEDVHHIDGDKLNNNLSNLKLMCHGDHTIETNKKRQYNRGYKLKIGVEERQRRSLAMKQMRLSAIKKATE